MRPVLLILLMVACGGSSPSPSSNTGGNQPSLVVHAVGAQSFAIAAPGGTLQLTAYGSSAGPYGGTTLEPVTASWSSSNTAVATVDRTGLVTGVANGTAVITASAGSATGQVSVMVGAMPAAITIE